MKLVYLAGPITAPSVDEQWENIMRARTVTKGLLQMGLAVHCPHLNTMLMDGACARQTFLDADLEILRRCDGLVVMQDWEGSHGTWGEIAYAKDRGIPIFFVTRDLVPLSEWAEEIPGYEELPQAEFEALCAQRTVELAEGIDSRVLAGETSESAIDPREDVAVLSAGVVA